MKSKMLLLALIVAFCGSTAWADEAREDRHDRELNEVKISKKINAANIAANKAAIDELRLNGSTTGPQGPAGADGATGPQGPAGPQGLEGPRGWTGQRGATGADGTTGPQGPAGADGATGPQGPAGADGAQGPQGPAGADGAQGPQGVPGPAGTSSLICYDGDMVSCYTGSAGTMGIGPCKAGIRTCVSSVFEAACAGEVTPSVETCADGIDLDCNGVIDDCGIDSDGDGSFPPQDCDPNNATVYPGATELCDGLDNNCDGIIDEGCPSFNGDGDRYTIGQGDCNDADPNIFPGATERCDGVDNNCDGVIDESTAIDAHTWFVDADGDGFSIQDIIRACSAPTGTTFYLTQIDCNDSNAAIYPGAIEVCGDGIDNNCSGADEVCMTDGTPCDDGNGCTVGDAYLNSVCQGTPRVCPGGLLGCGVCKRIGAGYVCETSFSACF